MSLFLLSDGKKNCDLGC